MCFHCLELLVQTLVHLATCASCFSRNLAQKSTHRSQRHMSTSKLPNSLYWPLAIQRTEKYSIAMCHMSKGSLGLIHQCLRSDTCWALRIFWSTNATWNLLTPVWIFGVELSARQATQSCADSRRGSKQKRVIASRSKQSQAVPTSSSKQKKQVAINIRQQGQAVVEGNSRGYLQSWTLRQLQAPSTYICQPIKSFWSETSEGRWTQSFGASLEWRILDDGTGRKLAIVVFTICDWLGDDSTNHASSTPNEHGTVRKWD